MTLTPRKLSPPAKSIKTATKPLTLAILLCAVASSSLANDTDNSSPTLDAWATAQPTGRVIVKYRTASDPKLHRRGPTKFQRGQWREKQHLALQRTLSDYQELVEFSGPRSQSQLQNQVRALSAESYIEYASIEYRRYPLLVPNDPLYVGTDGLGDQSYLYEDTYSMNAPAAWDITTGSSSSVIAIVDSGILPNHPEIQGRSIDGLGYDFVSADNPSDFTSANDGDGRDDNPTDPGDAFNGSPSSWHGTAIASAAAGNSNNGEGLTGIDWNARLLHARALGAGGGTDADIIDAVRWSAGLSVVGVPDNSHPANVVNLSLGGVTECTTAWQDVIDELTALNVTVVMAAGNEAKNALRSAPANCANVISVGSSTSSGEVDSAFSNYGLKVDITTPGRNIAVASNQGTSTADPDGNNSRFEIGTSFSAALVSGAISLMHSLDPTLSPMQVKALLHESATPFASDTTCSIYYCGAGTLDLGRTMQMLSDSNFNYDRDVSKELIVSQSTPIELQQDQIGQLSGYKDVQYFSVTVSERGLLKAESSSTGDPYGYLLNSALSVLALDDDSIGNRANYNFRISALVDPGTYYIAVERSQHRVSDGEMDFTLTATLSTDTPTPFEFEPRSNAPASSTIYSNFVTIAGLSGESIVSVNNGFYAINGGLPTSAPSTVVNGDTLILLIQSPDNANAVTEATLTVGTYQADFVVTTVDTTTVDVDDSGDNEAVITVDNPADNTPDNPDGNSTGSAVDNQQTSASSGCSMRGNEAFDPLFLLLLLIASIGITRSHNTQRKSIT